MADPQELHSVERKLYKELSRFYDASEYQKGINCADKILSVKPEHQDTIAMKALCLHALHDADRKESKPEQRLAAFDMVKGAIKKNMRSVVAWHSMAIMYRNEENISEAMKAYKMAHRLDGESINILRDLGSCCCVMRDWEGFFEYRSKMLALKAPVHQHWLGVALGHCMLKRYELAAHILDVMTQVLDPWDDTIALSEVQLLRVEVALACNNGSVALTLLKENDAVMLDQHEKLNYKAQALTLTGSKDRAIECYKVMISEGWSEHDAVTAIAKVKGIKFDAMTKLPVDAAATASYVEMLKSLSAEFPKQEHMQRLLLDVCPIAEFKNLLGNFCRRYVVKNIPALFSVLKSIYSLEPERIHLVGELFEDWAKQIVAGENLEEFNAAAKGPGMNPTLILWVWTQLAVHYSRTGDFAKAHHFIDKAIAHSPTVELLYMHQAKILRREGGRDQEAAQAADLGRLLDLQDKFVCSTAVKAWLRAGDIKRAEDTLGLFYSKPKDIGNHYLQAHESQTLWYELGAGKAFHDKGDYYSALQNLLLQEKHRTWDNLSMVDFHAFCIRIGKPRAWMAMVSRPAVDTESKFYLRFAPFIVKSYLKVHELGAEAVEAAHVARPKPVAMPPPDVLAPGEEPQDSADQHTLDQRFEKFVAPSVDLTDPLGKCKVYVDALVKSCPFDPDTHEVAYLYHRAKNQPLGCVRALQSLEKISSKLLNGKDKKQSDANLAQFKPEFKAWAGTAEGKAWPAAVTSLVKPYAA